jgi:ribosomal protein L14E/L6E/L27E
MPIVTIPRKRLISMDKNTVTIDLPKSFAPNEKKKIDYDAIRAAQGILKHKRNAFIEHAARIRDEWE